MLARFTNLETLFLSKLDVADDILPSIIKNWHLTSLVLNETKVTPEGFKACLKVMDSSEVTRLCYYGDHLSDDDVECLLQFPNLDHLWLDGGEFTDVSIETFGKMTNLTFFVIYEPGFTEAGIERLKEALPLCEITIQTESDDDSEIE
ncbi:MAG: hypothetical protein KDA65_09735 [Planctomycetaceae bacterium]|nr:hypothetical protein [Planctomycetaceae bacterium]